MTDNIYKVKIGRIKRSRGLTGLRVLQGLRGLR